MGLKELREQAGLTQSELGDKVGLTRSAISNIEKGKNGARQSTLSQLAEVLGTSVEKILTHTPESSDKLKASPNIVSDSTHSISLPFIPIQARAILLEVGADASITDHEDLLHLDGGSQDATHYANAIVLEVGADYMEPLLHAGDKIIAWHVPESRWAQVYNQVCVVAYEQIITIKIVRENELLTRDLLTLHAQNSIAGFLPVQRQQIKAIWRVEEFFNRPKIRL